MEQAAQQAAEITLQAEANMDQYLTFKLADEEYGVDILRVQEIKGWAGVTPVPSMPPFILGVINLRGTVVPIVDLRTYFELEQVPCGHTTVVIVVRVDAGEDGMRTMGLVVDAVSEVHNIARSDMDPAPDYAGAVRPEAIVGLASHDDTMLIMLDIDQLVNEGVLKDLDAYMA